VHTSNSLAATNSGNSKAHLISHHCTCSWLNAISSDVGSAELNRHLRNEVRSNSWFLQHRSQHLFTTLLVPAGCCSSNCTMLQQQPPRWRTAATLVTDHDTANNPFVS
jgi:hypothetical protein